MGNIQELIKCHLPGEEESVSGSSPPRSYLEGVLRYSTLKGTMFVLLGEVYAAIHIHTEALVKEDLEPKEKEQLL